MSDSTRAKDRSPRRPKGGPHPFHTDAEVADFAKLFLQQMAWGFKKNLDICLTAQANSKNKLDHAYMPALLSCMTFLDLLGSLYASKVHGHGLNEFLNYMRTFMPAGRYRKYDLQVLYIGFRHKIAHLSHPYFVLDTAREGGRIPGPSKRIAWTIYASRRSKPIELIAYDTPRTIKRQPTPWRVEYDHKLKVSIRSLAIDARKSLGGPNGYIAAINAHASRRTNFKTCMKEFYPT